MPQTNKNDAIQVICALVDRQDIKSMKTELESLKVFGKKIVLSPTDPSKHLVYTNIEQPSSTTLNLRTPHTLTTTTIVRPTDSDLSHLITPIRNFLTAHPPTDPISASTLLADIPKRYSIYHPLLLLPPTAFASSEWTRYLNELSAGATSDFYLSLAPSLRLTHVARNSPIAATSTIRAPTNLTPLYGNFGPDPTERSIAGPKEEDFAAALWVEATQNGIWQTWAPRYTMFSRGNITEKARVLAFPDVMGCEVADLYAGIGYFVFSYLKAGAQRVWCWELNPWSVEALLRGARRNGWAALRITRHETLRLEDLSSDVRVVVFEESNEFALERMEALGKLGKFRACRHVNLGLLPTSEGSWGIAKELVVDGGYAHVHENCGESEMKDMMEHIVRSWGSLGRLDRNVKGVHTERVKTFAPGVVHAVFDLKVEGERRQS